MIEEFTFKTNREMYNLKSVDVAHSDRAVDNYILNVFQEYEKILNSEKARRRLHQQTKQSNKAEVMNDDLKKKRQGRRALTNP